jgi:hypothetical protein
MNKYIISSIAISNLVACVLGLGLGAATADEVWRNKLVQINFAQYNTKTGKWQIRTLEDIATDGIILGKCRPVNLP